VKYLSLGRDADQDSAWSFMRTIPRIHLHLRFAPATLLESARSEMVDKMTLGLGEARSEHEGWCDAHG
jgi:hypothetical protein